MKRLVLVASAVVAVLVIAALLFVVLDETSLPTAPPRAATIAADTPTTSSSRATVATFAPMPITLRQRPDPGAVVTSTVPPRREGATIAMPRIVTSPGISPGPSATTALEREVAPPPPVVAAIPTPSGPDWETFPQVVVIGAGKLNLAGRRVQLADIVVPGTGSRCHVEGSNQAFECASLSMQALRQRIRGRGVECFVGAIEHLDTETVHCRIGQADLGLWLIQQGWGTAADGAEADYAAAERSALCGRRGIWAETTPPADCAN